MIKHISLFLFLYLSHIHTINYTMNWVHDSMKLFYPLRQKFETIQFEQSLAKKGGIKNVSLRY